MISNPDAGIIADYRSSFLVPKALAAKYKNEYGLDLELYSGRQDYLIAVPATYVIDADGVIRFAYADTDYTTRVSPDQVLDFLKSKNKNLTDQEFEQINVADDAGYFSGF